MRLGEQPVECALHRPGREASFGQERPNLRLGEQPVECMHQFWLGGQTALGQERPNLQLGEQPVECVFHWPGSRPVHHHMPCSVHR